MSSIEKSNDKTAQTAFNKKIVSASQQLHPYVKHRLYIAESTGIIPKKMYASNGIIDESIITFYEKGYDADIDKDVLKLKLFKIVDADLETIFKKEAFHKNTISTHTILEEELDALKEKYTIDDGFDYIMNEDLDDISYQQNGHSKHVFLYVNNDNSILNTFETNSIDTHKSNELIGTIYSSLPLNVSNIIDLYAFGKLSIEDISKVKSIEVKRIERIINTVKKTFETNLD
ncbi:hypothetical protein QLS71_014970 [Mariniflexile litorale]|uniref:Uncharacterized protein n=1 Tax=Mariniflexile litorale TaxID=3045158 RepID=A0AAU7EBZ4_9FLAO|nr:hypothetical protein [Mariniflexile sp. KMM 9835]MDQ8213339.1 hypothetical protein [Mariniflexile sp. KMM 9835]